MRFALAAVLLLAGSSLSAQPAPPDSEPETEQEATTGAGVAEEQAPFEVEEGDIAPDVQVQDEAIPDVTQLPSTPRPA